MHRNEDKYMLRLPDGWRAAIKARAVKNHRSMNNEILAALEGVVTAAGVILADVPPPPCRLATVRTSTGHMTMPQSESQARSADPRARIGQIEDVVIGPKRWCRRWMPCTA